MTTFFRYVPHDRVEAMKAQGWTVANDMQGTRHGTYAVLMQWEGTGEPD